MADNHLKPQLANILLVDDRLANLLALESVLADLGENLVRATSGEEALKLLAEKRFAVVLLDVRMPILDGFETAKRVRKSERTRHTPIIFISAVANDEFPVSEAYRLGAVDYLVKPIVPEVLRAKVAAFVELFWTGERLQALERRERERAEQRFARFMEHLPGLAWIKDAAGRYLYYNDAAVKAIGKSRQELYGRTDDEIFPPAMAAEYRKNDQQAIESVAGVQMVETLTHQDGSVHYSIVSKFPIPGPDGQPPLVGGVAIDVTDRRKAEEALRASEERYRALVQATSQVVWSWSPRAGSGVFSNTQRWWERLTGQSLEEQSARGFMCWQDMLHPEDRERVIAAWDASIATGEPYDIEYRVRARQGGWRHIRAHGIAVRGPDGDVREWVERWMMSHPSGRRRKRVPGLLPSSSRPKTPS